MYTLNERAQITKAAEIRHIMKSRKASIAECPSLISSARFALPSILCLTTLGAIVANQASIAL